MITDYLMKDKHLKRIVIGVNLFAGVQNVVAVILKSQRECDVFLNIVLAVVSFSIAIAFWFYPVKS